MSSPPFLILKVRSKKDVLAVRQKARLVAQLLCFEPHDQTCIAAGAFAVACQALARLGKTRVCLLIEQQQLHIFAREADTLEAPASSGQPPLLRLAKPLPREKGLAETDVAWLVSSLDLAVHGNLFEEIARQNQEVLTLLHELQASRAPSAA